jgi:hypothetical protein
LGSAIILVLTKLIAGSGLILNGKEHGDWRMFVLGIAVMVFMLPLALAIYYKAYKMLTASVDGDVLVEEKDEEAEAEAFEAAADRAETENKAKKEETVEEEVVEPEVIPPVKNDDEDEISGV